jgi:hypothetical protein
MGTLYDDRRPLWYDAHRTIELRGADRMSVPTPKLPIPPSPEAPSKVDRPAQRNEARLAAIVEAAYILEAIRG